MIALRLIGSIWVLPVALPIWLFYILPAWAAGCYDYDGVAAGVVRFRVVPGARPRWHARRWRGFGGLALPFAAFFNDNRLETELHELYHCNVQWLALGPLFPIVYLLLWVRDGYFANPLERAARVYAHREMAFLASVDERR